MPDPLWILISVIVGLLLRDFLPGYFSEKGRNLATKEDIGEIAEQIEGVRSEHAQTLEHIRSGLRKKVHAHRGQVELEIRTYEEARERLVKLQSVTLALRPPLDRAFENEAEEKEERRKRLEAFSEAAYDYSETLHKRRPFYPSPVFEKAFIHRVVESAAGDAT